MRWILCICVGAVWAQTVELPETVKQGGVIRVRGPVSAASARMGDRKIRLFPQTDGEALGLLPIPADQKPGSYRVDLLDNKDALLSSSEVAVVDAHFRKQNVVIEQR